MSNNAAKGKPFQPSAQVWNQLVDGLRNPQTHLDQPPPIGIDPGWATVLALVTGSATDQYGVAKVSGPNFTPTQNEEEFRHRFAVRAGGTGSGFQPGRSTFATGIALQPSPTANFLRYAVGGLAPVKVDIANTLHEFARPVANTKANMASSPISGFPILWKESGTGVKWAIVRLSPCTHGVHYVIATTKWRKHSDNSAWDVLVNPILTSSDSASHLPGTVDTSTELRVFFDGMSTTGNPWRPCPNVQIGDRFFVQEAGPGYLVPVSAWVWDDPPGTIRVAGLRQGSGSTFSRRGWAIANGTANSTGNGGSGRDFVSGLHHLLLGGEDSAAASGSAFVEILDPTTSTINYEAGATAATLPDSKINVNNPGTVRNPADNGVRINLTPLARTLTVWERLDDSVTV